MTSLEAVPTNMQLSLRGRKDQPDLHIHHAIAQKDWRRALQLIEKREKRLKKGQPNDWLMVCTDDLLGNRCGIDMILSKGLQSLRTSHASRAPQTAPRTYIT